MKKLITVFLILSTLISSSLFSITPKVHALSEEEALIGFCNALLTIEGIAQLFPILPPNAQLQLLEVFAENRQWYNQSLCQFYVKVFDSTNEDELFGERYTYAQINWIINSIQATLLNFLTTMSAGWLLSDNLLSPSYANKNIDGFPSLISYFIENQSKSELSLLGQTRSFLSNFNLATPVDAQGYGFRTLVGVQPLWAASRNMVYFLMVVILVAAGLSIILRVKLNAQTVVSIQVMIPKIIFTLISVTFSFAIAGFLIDLVYIIIGSIIYFTPDTFIPLANKSQAVAFFTSPNPLILISFYTILMGRTAMILSALLTPIVGTIFVIVIATLIWKVFVMMLKSYVMVIIEAILAPWRIGLGLFPTSSGGLGTWFRNFIGTLIPFIVVPILMLLTAIFWNSSTSNWVNDLFANLFSSIGIQPNIKGIDAQSLPSLPLFGNTGPLGGDLLKMIMGYAILALMPKLVDNVRSALKAQSLNFDDNTLFGPIATAAGTHKDKLTDLNSYNFPRAFNYLKNRSEGGSSSQLTTQDFSNIQSNIQTPDTKGPVAPPPPKP